jgi:hypothetical protein
MKSKQRFNSVSRCTFWPWSTKSSGTFLKSTASISHCPGSSDLSNRAIPNEDRNIRVNILSCDVHNSACPVRLLIIHALRVGAVTVTTWKELRANAIFRVDKTIQWTTTENPVIPAGQCSDDKLSNQATLSLSHEVRRYHQHVKETRGNSRWCPGIHSLSAWLNFSESDLVLESGIDLDIVTCALEILELVVTPEEGNAIQSAFSGSLVL